MPRWLIAASWMCIGCAPSRPATPPTEPEAPAPAKGPTRELASPDHGTLIVLNKAEATASLIDLRTGEVAATVNTGEGPHEVAVSPAGNIAVATNYGTREAPGSSLTVIDVAHGKAIDTVTLADFHRPHGIEFLDDEHVLVTVEEEKAVLCVDYHHHAITCTIETGQDVSHMVSVTPDGTRAFVANIGSGTVSVLDMQAKALVASIATGAGAEGVDVTPDGTQVWVTNREDDTVTVLDTKTLEVKVTLPSKSFPIRAAATPDGGFVLVTNARSGVVNVFDTQSLQQARSIPIELRAEDTGEGRMFGDRFGDSSVPIGILIHPDGNRAYVAHAGADVITVLDLQHWEPTEVLRAGKEPDGLAYSDETVRPED